ncbi:MAG: hypothetical protein ACLTDR_07450 [Adlercreutzia equolifaciens]
MEETVASCLAELDGAGESSAGTVWPSWVVVAHGVLALGRGDDVPGGLGVPGRRSAGLGSGSRIDVERRLLGAAARWRAWRRPGRWAPAPMRPLPADPSWCGSSLAAIAPWTRWWTRLEPRLRSLPGGRRAGAGGGGARGPRPAAAFQLPCPPHYLRLMSRRERPARAAKSSGAPVVEDPERGRSLPVSSAPRTAMAVAPEVSVEPLRLKLFGTMEVALGRRDITYQFEGRPKTRLLLALLALHRGRELGRDQIVSMLWPAADKRTGAKSFYRVWGDLRSLLSQQGRAPTSSAAATAAGSIPICSRAA